MQSAATGCLRRPRKLPSAHSRKATPNRFRQVWDRKLHYVTDRKRCSYAARYLRLRPTACSYPTGADPRTQTAAVVNHDPPLRPAMVVTYPGVPSPRSKPQRPGNACRHGSSCRCLLDPRDLTSYLVPTSWSLSIDDGHAMRNGADRQQRFPSSRPRSSSAHRAVFFSSAISLSSMLGTSRIAARWDCQPAGPRGAIGPPLFHLISI